MLSTKKELIHKLILWLDDVSLLRNIILIFIIYFLIFNVNKFNEKLGKQYGAFYLFATVLKENIF